MPCGHFEWQKSASGMASKYFLTLSEEAQRQYKEKLQLMGGIEDPYIIWESSSLPERYRNCAVDWQKWPEVEYPD